MGKNVSNIQRIQILKGWIAERKKEGYKPPTKPKRDIYNNQELLIKTRN